MIIVTAGHVDHGKTSLVRHLTGVETDRLKDEQTRGLTIDLGFAYADLEDQRVGFVDVPGHIRFIHNMLAGVSGVQLALLVIAADDGPMSQTREHLAIIEALGLDSLMVAHTKVDRVDQVRREASRQEISTLLSSTRYASADIIDISNASLEGIELLRSTLCQFARDLQSPNAQASEDLKEQNFRLPIDRVFSIKGAGSVVTGTVASGTREHRRYAPRAAEWASASGKKYPHARSCSRSGGSRTTMCFKRCADGWRISTTRQRVLANQPMPDRSAAAR